MALSKMHLFCVFAFVVVSFLTAEAALPEDLSNYQNEHVCNSEVRLVRPLSVADVQKAVLLHENVVAVGSGHSWNKAYFCPGLPSTSEATSAVIVMTTIRPLTIDVDEAAACAWVSAGVTIWDLMDYLAAYKTPTAPRGTLANKNPVTKAGLGYALGATPLNVNHTIGGAIATGTHGNSIQYASLSNQVLGFKVVLANGTWVEIFPESDPLLFRALQVNVGRLGVVTDVRMRIIPQKFVKRTVYKGVARDTLMPRLRIAQDMYRQKGLLPDWIDNEPVFEWSPVDSTFTVVSFDVLNETAPEEVLPEEYAYSGQPVLEQIDIRVNKPLSMSRAEKNGTVAEGLKWKMPKSQKPDLRYADVSNRAELIKEQQEFDRTYLFNATLETHLAALTATPEAAAAKNRATYDSYEVAVAADRMTDCLQAILNFLDSEKPDNGLRSSAVFRFVGKENALLSASHKTPVLWFNFQEYVSYNTEPRESNFPFKRLMLHLVTSPSCSPAYLHWGGAGWPNSGCWNGGEKFGARWCDFGCAVQKIDPYGKFAGLSAATWNWNGADLEKCCTEEGYNTSRKGCGCNVTPVHHSNVCPPAPYYSD